MTTVILVWILVVGEAGGHNGSAQFGPFPTMADCQRVAASAPLLHFDKQCVQVNMVFGDRP
jgi:hypothetical protein